MRLSMSIRNIDDFHALLKAFAQLGETWLLLFSPKNMWLSLDVTAHTGIQTWSSFKVETFFQEAQVHSRVQNLIGLRVQMSALVGGFGAIASKTVVGGQMSLKHSPALGCTVLRLTSRILQGCVVSKEVPAAILPESELAQVKVPEGVTQSQFDLFLPRARELEQAAAAFAQLHRSVRVTCEVEAGLRRAADADEHDPLLATQTPRTGGVALFPASAEPTGALTLALASPYLRFQIAFRRLEVGVRERASAPTAQALALEVSARALFNVARFLSKFDNGAVSVLDGQYVVFSIAHDPEGATATYVIVPRVSA